MHVDLLIPFTHELLLWTTPWGLNTPAERSNEKAKKAERPHYLKMPLPESLFCMYTVTGAHEVNNVYIPLYSLPYREWKMPTRCKQEYATRVPILPIETTSCGASYCNKIWILHSGLVDDMTRLVPYLPAQRGSSRSPATSGRPNIKRSGYFLN